MMSAPPPVLFVTNIVPADRAGAFAALHAREGIELALFGGRSHHATAGLADPGVPYRRVRQRDVLDLAGRSPYRAVVARTPGPPAPPPVRARAPRARGPRRPPRGVARPPPRRHAVPALERPVGPRAHPGALL